MLGADDQQLLGVVVMAVRCLGGCWSGEKMLCWARCLLGMHQALIGRKVVSRGKALRTGRPRGKEEGPVNWPVACWGPYAARNSKSGSAKNPNLRRLDQQAGPL
jgi:hypothetical protein